MAGKEGQPPAPKSAHKTRDAAKASQNVLTEASAANSRRSTRARAGASIAPVDTSVLPTASAGEVIVEEMIANATAAAVARQNPVGGAAQPKAPVDTPDLPAATAIEVMAHDKAAATAQAKAVSDPAQPVATPPVDTPALPTVTAKKPMVASLKAHSEDGVVPVLPEAPVATPSQPFTTTPEVVFAASSLMLMANDSPPCAPEDTFPVAYICAPEDTFAIADDTSDAPEQLMAEQNILTEASDSPSKRRSLHACTDSRAAPVDTFVLPRASVEEAVASVTAEVAPVATSAEASRDLHALQSRKAMAPDAPPVAAEDKSEVGAQASTGLPPVATLELPTVSQEQVVACALQLSPRAAPAAPPLFSPDLHLDNTPQADTSNARAKASPVATAVRPREVPEKSSAIAKAHAAAAVTPVATSGLPEMTTTQAVGSAKEVYAAPAATPVAAPVLPTVTATHAVSRAKAPCMPVITAVHAVSSAMVHVAGACASAPALPVVSAERAVALAKAHAAHTAHTAQHQPSRGANKDCNQRKLDSRTSLVEELDACMAPMENSDSPQDDHAFTHGEDAEKDASMHGAEATPEEEVPDIHDNHACDGQGVVDGWRAFQKLHFSNKDTENPDVTVDELADVFGLPGAKSKFVESTLDGADEIFGPEYREQV